MGIASNIIRAPSDPRDTLESSRLHSSFRIRRGRPRFTSQKPGASGTTPGGVSEEAGWGVRMQQLAADFCPRSMADQTEKGQKDRGVARSFLVGPGEKDDGHRYQSARVLSASFPSDHMLYIYIYIHINMCAYIYIYIYTHICIIMQARTSTSWRRASSTSSRTASATARSVQARAPLTYFSLSLYIYIYTYMYIHIYIYIYRERERYI